MLRPTTGDVLDGTGLGGTRSMKFGNRLEKILEPSRLALTCLIFSGLELV